MDPKCVVRLGGPEGEEILFVSAAYNYPNAVWVEGESGNDMISELSERLSKIGNGLSASPVYVDMFNCGITPSMVRKYLGNEEANKMSRYLEASCQEIEAFSAYD